MKHRATTDGRPRRARAAIAALTISGVALIGAGVASQESLPTLSPEARAATVPGAGSTALPAGEAPASGPPVATEPRAGANDSPGSPRATGGAPADLGPVLPEAEPLSVSIPAIGASSPTLVSLGLTDDGALEVPQDYDLAGWYRHGPAPGELGPAVLAGHVDSAAEGPAVFFRLAEVQAGDEVLVDRADGTTAVFAVDAVQQYPKDAFPTEQVYGDTDHAALRLITCGGDFDRRSGSYRDNIVVYAHLVGVR